MSNVPKAKEKIRVMVWFDRPRDCVCFADRLDSLKDGEPIPEELTVRIPLADAEDFVEALINVIRGGEDFWKIMDGVQALLDRRAADATTLAERLRLEWSKRSGGGVVGRNRNEALVRMDEWSKFAELRRQISGLLKERREEALNVPAVDQFFDWCEERGIDEPGSLSKPTTQDDSDGKGAEEGHDQ